MIKAQIMIRTGWIYLAVFIFSARFSDVFPGAQSFRTGSIALGIVT